MSDEIRQALLDGYMAGTLDAADRARVEAWLAADPVRAGKLDRLRSALGGPERDWDVEAAWQRVRLRMEGDTVLPLPRRHAPASSLLRAAVIAGLLLTGWIGWRLLRNGASPNPVFVAAATAAAQRDTVVLADGSTVILAPSSRLAAVAFDDTVRALELEGEAFFSVAHDVDRPFRVRSGEARVQVLGTEFTVRAREGSAVTVAVREGRVALAVGDSGGLTLTAGQVGRIADGRPVLLEADSRAWLSWLDGVLEFDEEVLTDVAADLSRWFGVTVRLADPALDGRRVTGRFATGSVEQAVDALSITLGITWTLRDGEYVLGPAERN